MAEGDFGGVTGTRAETTEDKPAEGDSGGVTGLAAEKNQQGTETFAATLNDMISKVIGKFVFGLDLQH
jgi:hypothetical protein